MTTIERILPAALLWAAFSSLAGCGSADETSASATEGATASIEERGVLQVEKASLAMLAIQTVAGEQEPRIVWAPGRAEFRDDRVASVDTAVSARIVEFHARVGDSVRAGAPLATLASPEAARIRTEYSNARVNHEVALAEARRQRAMLEKGVGTEIDKVAAEAKLQEAQHELERTERTVAFLGDGQHDRFVLRSPRNGVIAARFGTSGATAEPGGEPLFVVGDPDAVWLVADVFESDVAGLRAGAAAEVELAALPGTLRGKVQRIGVVSNEANGRIPVFIALEKDTHGIRPGMTGRVGISIEHDSGTLIPLTAVLIKDEAHSIVYVQRSDTEFEPRTVTLGRPSRGVVPVLGGLKPGERIVVRGGLLLDGAAGQLM